MSRHIIETRAMRNKKRFMVIPSFKQGRRFGLKSFPRKIKEAIP